MTDLIPNDPDIELEKYRVTVRHFEDNYETQYFDTLDEALQYVKENRDLVKTAWLYRAEWVMLNLNDNYLKRIWNEGATD